VKCVCSMCVNVRVYVCVCDCVCVKLENYTICILTGMSRDEIIARNRVRSNHNLTAV
jgi:hypothetical protein